MMRTTCALAAPCLAAPPCAALEIERHTARGAPRANTGRGIKTGLEDGLSATLGLRPARWQAPI